MAQKKEILYELYKDIDVATDAPAFFYWDLIMEVFPDCKLIFHERPVDKWFPSYFKTCTDYRNMVYGGVPDVFMQPFRRVFAPTSYFAYEMIENLDPQLFGENTTKVSVFLKKPVMNEFNMKRCYLAHNAMIKTNAPKDRLLILEDYGDFNWEILCGFVGVAVPDLPFPAENRRSGDDSEIVPIISHLLNGTGNIDAGVTFFETVDKEFTTRMRIFSLGMGIGCLGLGFRYRDNLFGAKFIEQLAEKMVTISQ